MTHTYTIHYDILNKNGQVSDIWLLSLIIYTSIIFVVDLKIALTTEYWTWIYAITLFITSIIPYILFMIASSYISEFKVYNTIEVLVIDPDFYLLVMYNVNYSYISFL